MLIPACLARSASRRVSPAPRPRPCQASTTVTATSADRRSRRDLMYRAMPTPAPARSSADRLVIVMVHVGEITQLGGGQAGPRSQETLLPGLRAQPGEPIGEKLGVGPADRPDLHLRAVPQPRHVAVRGPRRRSQETSPAALCRCCGTWTLVDHVNCPCSLIMVRGRPSPARRAASRLRNMHGCGRCPVQLGGRQHGAWPTATGSRPGAGKQAGTWQNGRAQAVLRDQGCGWIRSKTTIPITKARIRATMPLWCRVLR